MLYWTLWFYVSFCLVKRADRPAKYTEQMNRSYCGISGAGSFPSSFGFSSVRLNVMADGRYLSLAALCPREAAFQMGALSAR
jgi:hypothetical protein